MRKIAFVDDEKNVLDGFRRMLRSHRKEWDMHFYLSGSDALSALSKTSFDMVITDMRMPSMTGCELLQKVKDLSPTTHRIVLSGYANDEMILESVHATHQFISKPADKEKIIKTIKRAVCLQKSLHASGLKATIGAIESLPSLPAVYDELMKEISSDEASIERVGEIIEKDMALSSSLLKIVNSAFFSLVRHIESPCQAASVLGLEAIKNLALASVFSKFQKYTGSLQGIEQLNSFAQKVGILAGRIAKGCDMTHRSKDHAQIAGMMVHLGDLVATTFADQIDADTEESHDLPLLGSYLLGIWSMPYPVVEAVRWYRQPALSEIDVLSPLAVVHAAWAMLTLHTQQQDIDLQSDIIDIDYLDAVVGRETVDKWKDIANDFCNNVNSDNA